MKFSVTVRQCTLLGYSCSLCADSLVLGDFGYYGGLEECCHLSSVTKTSARRLKELLFVTQRFRALYNHKPVNIIFEVPLKCSIKGIGTGFFIEKSHINYSVLIE